MRHVAEPTWPASRHPQLPVLPEAAIRLFTALPYGISEKDETALLEAKLDPARFPTNNLLPQPLSQKARFTNIQVLSMRRFVSESGKLAKLDELLRQLKNSGHRVLLYFRMTCMIDLMEEYEPKKRCVKQIICFEEHESFADDLLSVGDGYTDNKPDHPRRKRTKKHHDSDDDFEAVTRTTPSSNVLRKGGELHRQPIQ